MKINLRTIIPKYTRRGYKVNLKKGKQQLKIEYRAGSHRIKLYTPKELNWKTGQELEGKVKEGKLIIKKSDKKITSRE